MPFRFETAVRARRHDPKATLSRRSDDALPFIESDAIVGNGLLLDTCVYIDQMKGNAPPIVEDLISVRSVNHSAIAVQELLHTVGALDSADPRTEIVIDTIGRAIDAMPPYRLFTPDLDTLAISAVYAGILSRTQGYAKDNRMKSFNDAVLFMQAAKLGLSVLTRNVADFDILLQMRPAGRVLFYR